jgi:single-stranded DNA-binding protein
MITISVHGRLAAQPELKMLGKTSVCEFRVLSTRFSKGEEHTEAVTFFCFDRDAEEICSTTVKGQEFDATGTQETSRYTDAGGNSKSYVKYRLTWFSRGRKPYTGDRNQQQGSDVGRNDNRNGGFQQPQRSQGSYLSAQPQSGQTQPQRQPEGRQDHDEAPQGRYQGQDRGYGDMESGHESGGNSVQPFL